MLQSGLVILLGNTQVFQSVQHTVGQAAFLSDHLYVGKLGFKSGFSCCTAIPVSVALCIAFRSLKNELVPANQFKRNTKKQWQILLGNDWITVAGCLINGEPIPEKYKDHSLTGNYYGYRECHIRPDMLLHTDRMAMKSACLG
ncbi:type II toxin-antitoxin system YafQ family toxin [Neisseria polysaccharea]|uniref:type II toxin-antitoxin system YafQ family toxin n=1 Tax=Neisseria polysaccharea TaxID=489 RepID=UPI0027DF25A4|nr:type II toxin-antitoxin system YafQ family toxin [Neisseria polysaccharea]